MKKIKSIKSLGVQKVYDVITESTNHNFVLANGVVAHNCNSTQPALRNFMEEFSSNCGFILTCNFKNRLIEPLQSRCSAIDFSSVKDKDEKKGMFMAALKRVLNILSLEKVDNDPKVVAELLKRHFPDLRKTLNELQRYSKVGRIDTGILAVGHSSTKDLMTHLKDKDFKNMRIWVAENSDIDFDLFVSELYKMLAEQAKPESLPQLILHLNEGDYRNSFVSNKEVNLAAMLTNIMADAAFK